MCVQLAHISNINGKPGSVSTLIFNWVEKNITQDKRGGEDKELILFFQILSSANACLEYIFVFLIQISINSLHVCSLKSEQPEVPRSKFLKKLYLQL